MKNYLLLLLMVGDILPMAAQVKLQSLQEVIKYADSHAFAIQSSKIELQVNESEKLQAQSFLYPTITATSGYTDNITLQSTLVPAKLFNTSASDDEFKEMTFGKQHVYNTGVQAQWDVLNFQKIFASKTADRNIQAGKVNTEKTKYSTYNQLASTYYSILLTQKSIDIYTENVAVTKVLLESAREKYKSGIIGEEDLNRVSIQHIQNEKNLENVRSNLQQLYKQFQSQLNTNEGLSVSGNIESKIISNTEILNVSPEVSYQEAQVRISESKLQQSQSMHLPSLSFLYQYNYNWTTNHFMDFSTANKLPSQFLGIKLSVPIFTGFSTRGKVKESKAELQLQQLQLDNVRLVKSKEDEILKLQYVQSENSLNKTKEILKLQAINDSHSNNKYENGIISIDARMYKYNDLLTAQYNYLQVLADYSIAQYKIYIRQMDFNISQ